MCDPEKTKHFLTCLPKSFHCKNLVWPGPPPGRSCVSPLFFNLLSSLVLCYLFPIELDGVNLVSSLWKPRGQKLHWNNPSVTGWVPFFPLTFLCLDFDNMPSAIGGRMGTLLLDGFCDWVFTPSLWCTLWCTIQATFHSALSHATVSQQSDTGQHLQFLRCLVKCSHSSSINIQG